MLSEMPKCEVKGSFVKNRFKIRVRSQNYTLRNRKYITVMCVRKYCLCDNTREEFYCI